MSRELETRQLKQILTLARRGTFASAARALGLSQPALSRSIQSVEREVGGPLFDRHPRGVTPTPLGEMLVARAGEVLSQVADLRRELDLMRGIGTGVLRIGAGPAMRHRVLPLALTRLCRQHPGLNVEVLLGDWRSSARALLDREIDIFLGERSEVEGDERFEVMGVASETGRPLLGNTSGAPASAVTCDDMHVLRSLALHGDAVALLPRSIAEQDLAQGRLIALRVDSKMPTARPGAVWLRGRSLSPAGEAFLSALR